MAENQAAAEGGGGRGGGLRVGEELEGETLAASLERPSNDTPASNFTESTIKNARQSAQLAPNERLTLSWKGISVKTMPKGTVFKSLYCGCCCC